MAVNKFIPVVGFLTFVLAPTAPVSSFSAQEVSVQVGNDFCPAAGCPLAPTVSDLVEPQCLLSESAQSEIGGLRYEMKSASVLLRNADTLEEANRYMEALLSHRAEMSEGASSNNIAVRTVLLAEKFYALLQKAWYFGIKYGDLAISINPVIEVYNRNAGQIVTEEIESVRVVDGLDYVERDDYLAALRDMKAFLSTLLLEGSMSSSEYGFYLDFRSQRIVDSHPWEAKLADNQMLKEWEISNPELAKKQKDLYSFDENKARSSHPLLREVFFTLGSVKYSPISGC